MHRAVPALFLFLLLFFKRSVTGLFVLDEQCYTSNLFLHSSCLPFPSYFSCFIFFFLSVLFTSPLFFQRLLKLYFSTGLGFITGLKPQQIHKDTNPAVFGSCMSPQGRWGGRRGVMWWGWSSRRPLDTGRKTLKAELNLSTNVVIILIGLAVLVPQVT